MDEWEEFYSEQHQRPYYFNKRTQETVWVKPGEEEEAEEEESGEEESGEESDHEAEVESPVRQAPHTPEPLTPDTVEKFQIPAQPQMVSSRSDSVSTDLSLLGGSRKRMGKTLSEHRLNKAKESGIAPALPSLPGKATSKPTLTPINDSVPEEPTAASGELNMKNLFDEIKDLTTLSLTMYAKSHFHLDKGGMFKKAETVEDKLMWQSDTLKHSLHDRFTEKDLHAEAVKLFPYIQTYMGDRSGSDLDMIKIAQHLAQQVILHPELRDEFFCQVCKQVTKNPKFESTFKGWQLLAVMCGVVHPREEFTPYLKEFIETHVSRSDGIGELARFTKRRLESTIKTKCRHYVPSYAEMDAVRKQKPFILRVYLLDNTYKTVAMEASLSNRELCELVAEKMHLRESSMFSLFEYTSGVETKMLRNDDVILDALGRWEYEDERALKKKEIKKTEVGTRFRLVFKPKLILHTMEDVSDPACIDLLYVQSVFHVLCGNYPGTIEDALKMAALQLQVSYGDHNSETVPKGIVSQHVDSYVPIQWVKTRSPEDWERIIFEVHQRFSGRTSLDAKLQYLSYVKKQKLYGSSFFQVQYKGQSNLPESVVLAINHEGIQLLKPGIVKDRLASFQYSEIVSWAYTAHTFTFVSGDQTRNNNFTVNTLRGQEMSEVCYGYVNALLEASQ
eukprot:c3704_g1_i1.p1 GENE.c3704_g1_i1~~c3704_g1_i1.p1  ORF type:complete len:689 (+),score=150.35 c3704_g1_i1:48-2069(+)